MVLKIGSIFLVVIAARQLGVEHFGQFSFIITFSTLFLTLTDAGINFYSTREIARNPEVSPDLMATALGLKLFLSILAAAILSTLATVLDYSAEERIGFYIAAGMLFLDTFLQQFYAGFRGQQRMAYESIALTIEALITSGLGIIILLIRPSFILLLCVYVLAKGVSLSFLMIRYQSHSHHIRIGFQKRKALNLLRHSLPFALNVIFGLVAFRLDIIFLRFLQDPSAVALYRVTLSIIFTLTIFPVMYQTAIYPVFSKLYVDAKMELVRMLEKSFGILFILALGLCLFIWRFADWIIFTVFGKEYAASIIILRIIVLMLPFKFVDQVLGGTLDSINLQKLRPIIAAICIVVNTVFCLIFIRWLGAIGAAISTVLTEFTIFGLYYVVLARRLAILSVGKIMIKGVSAGVTSYTLMSLVHLPLFVTFILGMAAFLGTLLLLQVHNDLDVTRHILRLLRRIRLSRAHI